MQKIKQIVFIAAIVIIRLVIYFAIQVTKKDSGNNYRISAGSQTVIQQIRSLNRLETAQYTIEKVIDAGTTGNRFQEVLFGDRLLLIAHGVVIAGFDFSQVDEEAIEIEDSTLRVTLPPPQILVTQLDNNQTRVYDRQQGLLTKGDENLESSARAEAEKIIKDAACQGGILNEAAKNARIQLTALFKSLNYTTVVITIPPARC